jgi:hypothetical protein
LTQLVLVRLQSILKTYEYFVMMEKKIVFGCVSHLSKWPEVDKVDIVDLPPLLAADVRVG